jgi:hypothetical protein
LVAEIARTTRVRLKILLAVAAIRTVSPFEPADPLPRPRVDRRKRGKPG